MRGNFQQVINGILESVRRSNARFREEQINIYSQYLNNLPDIIKINGLSTSDFIQGAHLGIKEMKFVFHALPVKPSWWNRLWFAIRYTTGKVKADLLYLDEKLLSPANNETIQVTLIVSTTDFKSYNYKVEPENIKVENLMAVK